MVVMDESHRLRCPSIKFFAIINLLEVNVYWFMIVTPAINDSLVILLYQYKENYIDQKHQDVLGLLKLLWSKVKSQLIKDLKRAAQVS